MVEAAWFFRDGKPFAGTPKRDEADRPVTMVRFPCTRCGGAGGADKWKHTGWRCFDCNGSGEGRAKSVRLYTAEQITKLDASRAKRQAKKQAAVQAAQAIAAAAAEARRTAFQAEYADVLPWLSQVGAADDADQIDFQTTYREGFLGDMLRRAHHDAEWSEAQATAVRAAYQRYLDQKRKARESRHVGAPGQRIEATVTVERVTSFYRPEFNNPNHAQTVWIVTMRDAAGNALVSKSPRFCPEKGASLTIRATVKQHDEYRDEAQTLLQRIKVVPAKDGGSGTGIRTPAT